MARRIPENRLAELVAAATDVFISRGFRLTQMSDVAEAVGVAKGTLYGYVESKDALLAFCLLNSDPAKPLHSPETLPFKALPKGQLGEVLRERAERQVIGESLAAALEHDRSDDPSAELAAIIGELYSTIERYRRVIKLIERCADHPEIHDIWHTEGRLAPRLALEQYLEMRVSAGQVRRVVDVPLTARLIVEVCSTWGMHIYWDRMPQKFEPDLARKNAIDILVHSLVI